MLTQRQRTARAVVTVVLGCLVVAGTLWGQDDHFPFGPFRMYSTTSDPNGAITVPVFRAVDSRGKDLELRSRDLGLRPAEVNGQIYFIRDDPDHLEHLADAYSRLHPDAPRLVELRLYQGLHVLRAGRPVAYEEHQLAIWSAS